MGTESMVINLWNISVKQNVQRLLNDFSSVLSIAELKKSNRFYQRIDRDNFLVRRMMTRLLFAKELGCSPAEIKFTEGRNRKPQISYPVTSLQFNLSHSDDYIVIAFGHFPIGVDIEKINPEFGFHDLLKPYFTEEEQAYILANEIDAIKAFFQIWTRKEAYLKYTGEGLLGDLKAMPNLITPKGEHFKILEPCIHPDYSCSLVIPEGIFKMNEVTYDHHQTTTPVFWTL